jgi:hypothetical protein
MGREFGYDLIEAVAQRPPAELRSGLDRLVEAGLLFCRGVVPQSSYLFKHALVPGRRLWHLAASEKAGTAPRIVVHSRGCSSYVGA